MKSLRERALDLHKNLNGKLDVQIKLPVESIEDLSLAYSPGVAEPCIEIEKNPNAVYDYTMKGNLVAVVTDGTAVLGLGDIGPEAALPVMEGKALLLKRFANVDAFPICLDTKDTEEIIQAVKAISPTFGAINLEDISAPRCFVIEERLREECNVPVFHDDQHGTAIVVGAGILNALKIVNKDIKNVRVVINGAGAAGISILRLLRNLGFEHMIVCDTKGIIHKDRKIGMNSMKERIAKFSNLDGVQGSLEDALTGADIFIGVSVANVLTKQMIQSMNNNPIVFALANPNPEISYDHANEWGVRIIATGRSDYPNQINNMLAFPGIFRGALDVRASDINEEMKLAAVSAIASLITEQDLKDGRIVPEIFDASVTDTVARAVRLAAISTGVARIQPQEKGIEI
ncbi:NADP-dependent malic enzyme [Rummeliibacillus pycnus]|uniref:NADP-dependent malic enzyme n=1 Tax=Rummeliibacillus pycnus TaxID=101070 RepID=UPI0037C835E5